MPYQSFEELEVWKRSCRLAVETFEALQDSKQFSLRDQIQRAVVSIPSNIAEGNERSSIADNIRFLRISLGSAAELRTQLYIASKIKMLRQEQASTFIQEAKELSAMLQGLIKSLSTRLPPSQK